MSSLRTYIALSISPAAGVIVEERLLAIDETGAAESLSSTPDEALIACVNLGRTFILPIDIRILCHAECRRARHVGVVSFEVSSFDDCDGNLRVFGQSRRNDEACGASAQNDVVITSVVDGAVVELP